MQLFARKLSRPLMRLPPKPSILRTPHQPSLDMPSSTTRLQNSGALRIPCSSRTNQAGKLKQKSNPTTIRGVSFAISISHSATSARVLPASSRTLTFPRASSSVVQTPAQICRRCPAASTRPRPINPHHPLHHTFFPTLYPLSPALTHCLPHPPPPPPPPNPAAPSKSSS